MNRFILFLCVGFAVPFFLNQPIGFSAPPAVKPNMKKLSGGVLLLHSGRVIKGKISQGSGEYLVKKSGGEMYVPESRVRFVCRDLKDAYAKQRAEIPVHSATHHVALAHWCIGKNLLQEARTELREAITLEPARQESRRMLNKLDRALRGSEPTDSAPLNQKKGSQTSEQDKNWLEQQELESLGGLNREDARLFARRIQPILLNNCANARCHGAVDQQQPQNGFQLTNIKSDRIGGRHAVERNLATVLKQLDFENPGESPLLTALERKHRQAVFRGRAGRKQMATLKSWIAQIAEDKNNREFAKRDLDQELRATIKESKPGKIQQAGFKATKKKTKLERQLLKRTDAFSPDEFNAQSAR